MKTDRERAPITMRRTKAALVPVGPFDDEMLEQYPDGAIVEVTIKRRRSNPQNALYWATLAKVVAATDAYPTAESLHEAIKMALGYTMPVRTFDGQLMYLPDSTAFGRMDAVQYKQFFDRAIELLNKLTGSDVLQEAA
jgi:hypothetical protein